MKRLSVSFTLLLASASFALTGGAREKKSADDRGVMSAIAQAPLETREWHNPCEGQPDAIAAGKKLYLQHCSECHAKDARGRGRAVNLRLPGVQNATPGELVWFLRNGNLRRGMPAWSGLPVERRWQIVTYLKSLRR